MVAKVLLTGAGGLLGSAIDKRFSSSKEFDLVAVRSSTLDLLDRSATFRFVQELRPDCVIHCAARVHGLGGNAAFPAAMYSENVQMNVNLVDAASASDVSRFVGVGTVACYPDAVAYPAKVDDLLNGPPHSGEIGYATAKRGMLIHLNAAKNQSGMSYCFPVFTNLYGPNDLFDEDYGHVIPSLLVKFMRAKQSSREVRVWGSGRAERDFLHSDDAASAIFDLVATGFEGPINVASGRVVSIAALVDHLKAITGVSNVQWDRSKPDGQLLRSYDIEPLTSLGWSQRFELADGLESVWNWLTASFPAVRGNPR